MSYFAANAQEEALQKIAREMNLANNLELLRELHRMGAISSNEYIVELKRLCKVA